MKKVHLVEILIDTEILELSKPIWTPLGTPDLPPRGSGHHVRVTLGPLLPMFFFAFGVQRVVYLQNPDFAFSVFPPTTKIIRFWKLR